LKTFSGDGQLMADTPWARLHGHKTDAVGRLEAGALAAAAGGRGRKADVVFKPYFM
jgi:hypothetical protein